MWAAQSFSNALDDAGLGQWSERGTITALGGTTAAQWATQPFLDLVTQELNAYPAIDIVHLSMGGNDVLGDPPANATEADAQYAQVAANIAIVVAHIRSVRPAARVALCSYDYVDIPFEAHFDTFMQKVLDLADLTPNFYVIDNWGLMQYHFGVPSVHDPLTLPYPGGYPDYTPLLGGDPDYPSPASVRTDQIHLAAAGYGIVAARCVEEFYAGWLGKVPNGVSIGVNDGGPLEVENGGRLELTANISGLAGPLAYQWRKDGEDLAAENAATFIRDPAAYEDSGLYSYFVSNGSGAKTLVESPPVEVFVGAEDLPVATPVGLAVLFSAGLVGGMRGTGRRRGR